MVAQPHGLAALQPQGLHEVQFGSTPLQAPQGAVLKTWLAEMNGDSDSLSKLSLTIPELPLPLGDGVTGPSAKPIEEQVIINKNRIEDRSNRLAAIEYLLVFFDEDSPADLEPPTSPGFIDKLRP